MRTKKEPNPGKWCKLLIQNMREELQEQMAKYLLRRWLDWISRKQKKHA